MKALVRILIVLPLAVVIVLLAVANRAPVQVSLDPFSGTDPLVAFTVPLFVLVLAAVIIGVLYGGFVVWWAQGRHRRDERLLARELDRMKAETARKSAEATATQPGGRALALTTGTNVR